MSKEKISVDEEEITIENVVSSITLDMELDLEELVKNLTTAEYNPENFPGLVYRVEEPKSSVLIFESGEIVLTGVNSIDKAHKTLEKTIEDLKDTGISIDGTPDLQIQNIVAGADLKKDLNLNAIAIGIGLENVEYEPEQFPGLVYRLSDPKTAILMFGSGKLVITGGTNKEDIKEAYRKTKQRLEELELL